MLGISDAWSMSRSFHQPIDPAYYIEDCRIFNQTKGSSNMIWFASDFKPLPLLNPCRGVPSKKPYLFLGGSGLTCGIHSYYLYFVKIP